MKRYLFYSYEIHSFVATFQTQITSAINTFAVNQHDAKPNGMNDRQLGKWRTNTNTIVILFEFCCWNLLNISIKMHIKLRYYCCYFSVDCMMRSIYFALSFFFFFSLSLFQAVYLCVCACFWLCRRGLLHESWIAVFLTVWIVFIFHLCMTVISIFNCSYYYYHYYYECTCTRSYLFDFWISRQ